MSEFVNIITAKIMLSLAKEFASGPFLNQIRAAPEPTRMKFTIVIPDDVRSIHEVFSKNGYKLYVVGGAVRDAVLGKDPKDFDLATDALPDVVTKILQDAGYRTLATGEAYGVINVLVGDDKYEIATFREDIGSGRRPGSVKFTTIDDDVKRRDLTINALFYDLDTNEVVDLVGGLEDIRNNVVRTVGDPQDRFGEDRLRILRAVRFAGRFGSDLDPAVDEALRKDASLEGISGERIMDEFRKGVESSKSVSHFLKLVDQYGLFDWVFPGLKVDPSVLEDNKPSRDFTVLLARLLKFNEPKTLDRKLDAAKYSGDVRDGINFLMRMLGLSVDTAYALKRDQKDSKLTEGQIKEFCEQEHVDSKTCSAFLRFRLSVKGEDVMKTLDIPPGKKVGEAIVRVETDNFRKLLSVSSATRP